MLVKAKALGYYNASRVYAGELFHLLKEGDFSDKWMEKVEGKVEEPKPKKKPKFKDEKSLDVI